MSDTALAESNGTWGRPLVELAALTGTGTVVHQLPMRNGQWKVIVWWTFFSWLFCWRIQHETNCFVDIWWYLWFGALVRRSYQPWLKVDWLRVQVKIAKNKELNHQLSARNWTDPPICLPQWYGHQIVKGYFTDPAIQHIYTPDSKCMALTYFLRGGCAIYLTVKKINPICTRNSKCARRWRNTTCAKCAKLRHYHIFNLNPFFRDRTFRSSKRWKSKWDVCSIKVGRIFFTTKLLNRWRNHLGQCHPVALEKSCEQCPKKE